ncbi:MAG: hypothetical protein ACYDCN_06800 [Bacteroidia bacterium]
MAKKDSFGEGVLAMLAILGGAYIVSEIAKSFAKKETVYSCPKCRYDIRYGVHECPNCHATLTWENKNTLNT